MCLISHSTNRLSVIFVAKRDTGDLNKTGTASARVILNILDVMNEGQKSEQGSH